MACNQDYTTFKNVSDYGDAELIPQTENNLKNWLDWAFLSIGAWSDATTSQSADINDSAFTPAQLNWVDESPATPGAIWQSRRKDWVYETGVNYIDRAGNTCNPVIITGISVNGTNYPTGGSPGNIYPNTIDYPMGRINFTSNYPSTNSTILVNHSYRNVQVYTLGDAPWWRTLQFKTADAPQTQFMNNPQDGDWSIGSFHRIQLPLIILECIPNFKSRGYELGNGVLWLEYDVLFHIMAEDQVVRNNLVSILTVQSDRTLWFFDTNLVAQSGAYPLDYRGMLVNYTKYPDLVSVGAGYQWKKATLLNARPVEIQSITPNLYEGAVRTTVQLLYGNF